MRTHLTTERTPPKYVSRRSCVGALGGIVASSQTLASEAGVRILREGGNAVDAAIATAAVLAVTEPCSTGIGGDCFILFYCAKERKVFGLNGSGRSGAACTWERVMAQTEKEREDPWHARNVTVPGAVAGWCDALEKWGTKSLKEVLAPAIELAEGGFPVGEITANGWANGKTQLMRSSETARAALLINGERTPANGEIFRNPRLAERLKALASEGRDAFYKGECAERICETVKKAGGFLVPEDLATHTSDFVTPLSAAFNDLQVYGMPPNGQGIVALNALNILEQLNLPGMRARGELKGPMDPKYLHLLVEALRLGFADARQYVCDPSPSEAYPVPPPDPTLFLTERYGKERAVLVQPDRAMDPPDFGKPTMHSETVSFQTGDSEGNAVSMVNSNFEGFGSGLIPEGEGFTLQNRGAGFSFDRQALNCYGPTKRPYHTIIPGMALHRDSTDLWASFTVMGGFMQPQGHVQTILAQSLWGMNPQATLDLPRFCLASAERTGYNRLNEPVVITLEVGVPQETVEGLRKMGHVVREGLSGYARDLFGRGQIIRRVESHGRKFWWGGSDGRADGACYFHN
uniref:Gamma-glutamyltransferase n=1 Tax=Chromera velia CCMP2878 TaxID=1169474 RepID=A0A0G4G9F0_9ALVE|eukprot:Cvel_20847.t1-p1 / transcript=Cvel_20847.t1 / gene=Cvel_20847 / organism=Chromera_velia_CCMP2878 / gene_product=Putative gamma-glutamyltransferase YwrD, putative / transcript_product=Putative gamma-glutamyltransferase YwrD, putative / location=Cvel_scaffold1909:20159-26925(+) / protein_length=576 / sequence_SO=supercontig / SO=protein_coding / is_pseudo=false